MDRLSKKILSVMHKTDDSAGFLFSVNSNWDSSCDAPFELLTTALKKPAVNVLFAIKSLAKEGWLEYKTLSSREGIVQIGVYMTHKGLHRKEFAWLEFMNFMTRSILVPIAVSVITSFIATLIGYLWAMSGTK